MSHKTEAIIINGLIGVLGVISFTAAVMDFAYNRAKRRPILDASTNGGVVSGTSTTFTAGPHRP